MKKSIAILAVLLVICLIGSTAAVAGTVPTPKPKVMELEIEDIIQDDLEGLDNYVLTEDGEPVLEVRRSAAVQPFGSLSDVTDNGMYTADFAIPGTTERVFIAGLTSDNISEIQTAVFESYESGESFTLADLGFIDTEKTYTDDDDDDMCWAASTSNILAYTGWGAQAGISDPDDLFELFINSFENKGGNAYYGLGWFFNGMDMGRYASNSSNFPKVKNYPNSGRYLPEYDFNAITDQFDLTEAGADGAAKLLMKLKSGCGASLNLEIYINGEQQSGHAVTCWGFVTDTAYPMTDKAHFKTVIITDSDSGSYVTERRDAPDLLEAYALEPIEQDGYDTYWFDYGYSQIGVLFEAVTLRSYSPEIAKETSASASLNRTSDPDLAMEPFSLTADSSDKESLITAFPAGSDLYFCPYFTNISDVAYQGSLKLSYTLDDLQKHTSKTTSFSLGNNVNIGQMVNIFLQSPLSLTKNIAPGRYTLTVEVNPEHTVNEAYFFNNAYSVDFVVGETYLIGDVDDDEEVASIDAVLILRKSADFAIDLDDRAVIRGDINSDGELDILDATYIQRYLAEMEIAYRVNVEEIYPS